MGSRNEVRDRCLLLLVFRHDLRVSAAKNALPVGSMRTRSSTGGDGPVTARSSSLHRGCVVDSQRFSPGHVQHAAFGLDLVELQPASISEQYPARTK
jgi:hypothetical protein